MAQPRDPFYAVKESVAHCSKRVRRRLQVSTQPADSLSHPSPCVPPRVCLCVCSSCSKVQAALLELRGTLGRADELLKSGAQSAEIEPVLASARSDMSQIHIDVKDLSQTITIVEEVRPLCCTAPGIRDRADWWACCTRMCAAMGWP